MEIQRQPEYAVEAAETEEEETEGVGEETEEKSPEPQAEAAATQPSAAEAKAKGDLNIIIQFHGPRFMLGIARADCDPIFQSMDGDLAAALQQVPAFVERAKQQWAVNPRYPKAPEPPPVKPTTSATPAAAPAKPKAQPSFF